MEKKKKKQALKPILLKALPHVVLNDLSDDETLSQGVIMAIFDNGGMVKTSPFFFVLKFFLIFYLNVRCIFYILPFME